MKLSNLYILPFDHRRTFEKDILGLVDAATVEDRKQIESLKMIIMDGFNTVREASKHPESFMILIDDTYGKHVVEKARASGIPFALAVEKSGVQTFEFAHGEMYKDHIRQIHPTFVKVLVRYNPALREENILQVHRLVGLGEFCRDNGYSFLFELLVPPTEDDLKRSGSEDAFYSSLRVDLTVQAIREISRHIHPDLWKLEGNDGDTWPDVLTETGDTPVIVLGRGADREKVISWIKNAAAYPSIVGFAVGRTIFMEPMKKYISHQISRSETVEEIRHTFASFVSLWEQSHS